MSLSEHPAAARTDVPAPAAPATVPAPRGGRRSRPAPEPPAADWVRGRGLVLAVGAAVWAAVTLGIGLNDESPVLGRISEISGLAFQLGVFALLRVMWRTRATGTSRFAAAMLVVEHVLLGTACVATLATTAFLTTTHPALMALDAFWPLSMIGMLLIAVKVALSGRWRGVLRVFPLWAEAYFPLVMGAVVIFGFGVADVASAAVVLTGYATLGVPLARRPELTGARRDGRA